MKLIRRSVPLLTALAVVAASVLFASTSSAQGPPGGSLPSQAQAELPADGFSLPAQAQQVAPGVWFLGEAVDNGVPVVGYAYEHHRDGHGGGPSGGGDPTPTPEPTPDASGCYSFIANGARWRVQETVTVDATNGPASSGQIATWMRKWETALGGVIYGGFTSGSALSADTASTDGDNEIYFGPIAEPGVLGYTIVWSSRIGPPSSRQIVEADMVIDTEWPWQVAVEDLTVGVSTIADGNFDLAAVFAHEAGHYVGLDHTATTAECEAQTMYPSLQDGDDRKQSLDVGDIAGVVDLYS